MGSSIRRGLTRRNTGPPPTRGRCKVTQRELTCGVSSDFSVHNFRHNRGPPTMRLSRTRSERGDDTDFLTNCHYARIPLQRPASATEPHAPVYRKSFDNDRPYEREFEGPKHFEPLSQARCRPGLCPRVARAREHSVAAKWWAAERYRRGYLLTTKI